jgi:DNA-binding NarL/FixJ family response regulator
MHANTNVLRREAADEKTSADAPRPLALRQPAPQTVVEAEGPQSGPTLPLVSREISVVVSDSTEMGCELLSSALGSPLREFQIAGTVVSGKELVAAVLALKPDIALVNIELREGPAAGLHALRKLHAQAPATRSVLLMDRHDPEVAVEALCAGASGVFLRDSPLQMLRRCIRVVREGQIWISNADLLHLMEVFTAAAPVRFRGATEQGLLTRREKEIVMLVVQGRTNREIAGEAHLSEHTVKNYLWRIFDKLGVSSRAELIVRFLTEQSIGA